PGRPVLCRARRRRVPHVLPVPAHQGAQPRGLLQGVPQQQLGGICDLPGHSARPPVSPQDFLKAAVSYQDLRDFIAQLEARGELKRVRVPVDPRLEMTEICDRALKAQGPALLFEKPTGSAIPVLGNLFGTVSRVALAMGIDAAQPNAA